LVIYGTEKIASGYIEQVMGPHAARQFDMPALESRYPYKGGVLQKTSLIGVRIHNQNILQQHIYIIIILHIFNFKSTTLV
jgi:hypothetical protein